MGERLTKSDVEKIKAEIERRATIFTKLYQQNIQKSSAKIKYFRDSIKNFGREIGQAERMVWRAF